MLKEASGLHAQSLGDCWKPRNRADPPQAIAVYGAALDARGRLAIAEIGARWGTWGFRAAAAARAHNPAVTGVDLLLVDSDEESCDAMLEAAPLALPPPSLLSSSSLPPPACCRAAARRVLPHAACSTPHAARRAPHTARSMPAALEHATCRLPPAAACRRLPPPATCCLPPPAAARRCCGLVRGHAPPVALPPAAGNSAAACRRAAAPPHATCHTALAAAVAPLPAAVLPRSRMPPPPYAACRLQHAARCLPPAAALPHAA
jgi:hypothetical protein